MLAQGRAAQGSAIAVIVLAGSGGGTDGIGRLPVPGQQLGDAFGRVVGDPGKDVGEIGLRIEAVELCRLDQ